MISRWLTGLNGVIVILILALWVGIGAIKFNRSTDIICSNPIFKQGGLPKGAFAMAPEAYAAIGEPLIALQSAPPSLQLPDLRQHLIYYGKNGRPDAQSDRTFFHFSLNGQKSVVSIPPGEPLYLLYDKKSVPSHYVFSPRNEETSLALEANLQDNEVLVKVLMKNDKGEPITEPEAHAQFKLPEKEFVRYAGATWEIGSWRVDGTLLARQRARWFGPDRFLERHGGDDFKGIIGKQRIDFGENDDTYSIFVGIGDCLIWDQSKWRVIVPGEESLQHPLLVVKKIDERLMTFELWDTEGKGKILLNLLKSAEPWMAHSAQNIQQVFKFVGARTRSQCVFEINRERMLISPSDWLLLTSKGWKKLVTEEDIDNYVKRKTAGALFVFEGLTRKEDKQILLGTLYNSSRSDFQTIELPIQQGGSVKSPPAKEMQETATDEKSVPIIVKPEPESPHPHIPPPVNPPKHQPTTH